MEFGSFDCCCADLIYPWAKKPYYEASIDGLNEQLSHFLEWVSPTEEEQVMRRDVCSRIEETVKGLWPHATVETIGSTCTNLCVPTSDIDMVIFGVSSGTNGAQPTPENLYTLARRLEEKVAVKNSVEVFSTAKVPIIKMMDYRSGIEVDISFGVLAGKENSKIIIDYCNKFPLARPLALIIKYFLKQKSLNNSWSGGIGSYTLIIMIISYLQLHTNPDENPSLVDLLYGFFRLYGDQFDYVENVISIANEGRYLRKTEKNWDNANNPHLLSVEDPHNPENDVGCIAFKIENAKVAFYEAYNILAESKSLSTASGNEEMDGERTLDNLLTGVRPDLTLSQFMWVNYSLHSFREKIKEIYRVDPEPAFPGSICPAHSNWNQHSDAKPEPGKRRANARQHQHQGHKSKSYSHAAARGHRTGNSRSHSGVPHNSISPQKAHKIVTTDYPALSS